MKADPAGFTAREEGTQPLRVAVYTSPWSRIVKPTGVGQHIVRMTECLSQAPGVTTSILATRRDYQQSRDHFPQSFSRMSVCFLPGRDRWIRPAMLWTSLLPIDRWSGEVDWVYSPKEFPVATRRARLAVTVHDVLPFERDVPGLAAHNRSQAGVRSRMIMRRILDRASLIATVSDFTRQRMLELFGPQHASRLVVVGNGVNRCYFEPAQAGDSNILETHGVTPLGYTITPGSLTFRKGGDLLLEIAAELQRRRLPLQLLVTGRRHDVELLERFKNMKREIPALPLKLAGYISDEEQAALMRHSAALLFPSRYEGFGIPVLEAMAAGTPTICSTAAAVPEVGGSAAIYVEDDRVDEWIEQLRILHEGQLDREAIVAAGKQHAAEKTWDRCAGRLVAAMRER